MLDLVFKNSTDDSSFDEGFFNKILTIALGKLTLQDQQISLSINLVNESEIQELNKKYRGRDRVTDVLSFPMSENFLEAYQLTSLPANSDLGDIFVCLSFAKNQAKSENIGIDRKLAQLAVHGFLHLLGYDHERSDQEAKTMFSFESEILNKISF